MTRLRFSFLAFVLIWGQFSCLFQVHAYHVSKHGHECGGAGGPRGLHVQRLAPPLHAPDRKGF